MKIENLISECSHREVKRFLADIKKELDKHDITLSFDSNLSRIGEGDAGCFFPDKKLLKCYMNNDGFNFLGVLAHERSHVVNQWATRSETWVAFEELEFNPEEIIKQKKIPPALTKYRRATINLEWECEKETIKLLKKYNLPLNIDKYIQTANLVLYSYVYMFARKHWPKLRKKDQVTMEEQMPTTLISRDQFVWSKMPILLKTQLEELRVK